MEQRKCENTGDTKQNKRSEETCGGVFSLSECFCYGVLSDSLYFN
ncbi:conserved hypothetical protein [Trichinella spiralis]|nr:conserved hypothetical protein [Trichinella spiralis]